VLQSLQGLTQLILKLSRTFGWKIIGNGDQKIAEYILNQLENIFTLQLADVFFLFWYRLRTVSIMAATLFRPVSG